MQEKTNVMRILEQKNIWYKSHIYTNTDAISGMEVVQALNENPNEVFKTLVTVSKSGTYYVFVVPVNAELDLKKAAKAVKEKNIEMIKQKELLPLTGYIHGGCSPIGMKKFFRTVIDISSKNNENMYISGGKIGFQVELKVDDISKVIQVEFSDIIKEN